jgi:threonine dehydratase
VSKPGDLNFAIIRDLVDEIVTVTEDETARALLVLLERAKLVVEPAGAVAVAAILAGKVKDLGTSVAVLSGGNIDPQVMERVISLGLVASDRYLKLRLTLADRPGQLARIAELISDANANVIEVSHVRNGRGALLGEVNLELSLETRGPEHVQSVLEHLREAGFEPRIDF